jgi:DNA invertase Pin-like site-specific DNA recombinase
VIDAAPAEPYQPKGFDPDSLTRVPETNDLMDGIMALVAEQAREAISRRTREALTAARRAVRLGLPTAPRPSGALGRAVRRSESAERRSSRRGPARDGGPPPHGGATSLRAVAAEMNARGILTAEVAAGKSRRP